MAPCCYLEAGPLNINAIWKKAEILKDLNKILRFKKMINGYFALLAITD